MLCPSSKVLSTFHEPYCCIWRRYHLNAFANVLPDGTMVPVYSDSSVLKFPCPVFLSYGTYSLDTSSVFVALLRETSGLTKQGILWTRDGAVQTGRMRC